MGNSIDASPLSRLLVALRPDWTRTIAARRTLAGLLVLLAAVAALRPDPADGRADVVVATRDLTPGVALSATDLRVESHSATTIPDGAQSNPVELVGMTLAGPTRRGEVLTDIRVLSPRLAEATAGPDARVVPLALADLALLDLLRPGDVVDILAASSVAPGGSTDAPPRVVATNAVVVLVSERSSSPASGDHRVVLVALPSHAAADVAGASLTQAVTLTLR
ncbi:SAF domain-containing protein [Mycolicibacterium sp. 624]|uniref:SAF domain-containing protein n=1 Tax=Mycolicibacterium sp. 624 TaxID=3156314 RepID=UPI003394E3F5